MNRHERRKAKARARAHDPGAAKVMLALLDRMADQLPLPGISFHTPDQRRDSIRRLWAQGYIDVVGHGNEVYSFDVVSERSEEERIGIERDRMAILAAAA